MLNNTAGEKSLTHTLAVIAFIVVMAKVIMSGASIVIGSFSYSFGSIDSLSIAAVLSPVLGAYVARRYTDANAPIDDISSGSKPGDGAS